MKYHSIVLWTTGLMNSIVADARSKTNSSKNRRCTKERWCGRELISKRSCDIPWDKSSLGISPTSIHSILHEHLVVIKICSRQIPQSLKKGHETLRWKEMLEKCDRGALKNVYTIVTGRHANELDWKQQSTVWVFENEPKPTKVVCGNSTLKQIVTCFFVDGNSEWYTTFFCLKSS